MFEKAKVKPMAMPLTKRERKKLRRQERAAREKDKQGQIAMGIIAPPQPKLKLSNLMRVLQVCFYLPLHFKRILLTILTCPPHILTF